MQKRDTSIDCLKGFSILLLAIVFMGYYFKAPGLLTRVFFSVEMPGFYVAAGFTVGRSVWEHGARYFWVRAFWLLCFAGALDVLVWGKFPLLYGESLSMCALAIPIVYSLSRRSLKVQWISFVLVILISALLQKHFGYRDVQSHQMWWWQYAETPLLDQAAKIDAAGALRSWFIDGWSPLFPFLAHFIFGSLLGQSDWRGRDAAGAVRWRPLTMGVAVLALAAVWWALFPGDNLRRFGYLEMSYPPVPAYVLFTCAFAFCFVVVMDISSSSRLKDVLQYFGRAPLACFLVANVMMRFAIYPYFPKQMRLSRILVLYALTVLAMAAAVFALKHLRRRIRRRTLPPPAKILFGGVGLPKQSG